MNDVIIDAMTLWKNFDDNVIITILMRSHMKVPILSSKDTESHGGGKWHLQCGAIFSVQQPCSDL
jgi:hypothetical protein